MSHEECDASEPISKAEFDQLLSVMKNIQGQMTTMKQELSEERDAAKEN